jgi:hypothetical protein
MDNNEIYILNSKRNINKYLYNYDYRKAFGLINLVEDDKYTLAINRKKII